MSTVRPRLSVRALHLNAKSILILALMFIVILAIIGGIDLINGGLVQPEIQLPSEVSF